MSDTPKVDELWSNLQKNRSHTSYDISLLMLQFAKKLERDLAARDEQIAALRAEARLQEEVLLGVGPISCIAGKAHERDKGCLYCRAEVAEARAAELEAENKALRDEHAEWMRGTTEELERLTVENNALREDRLCRCADEVRCMLRQRAEAAEARAAEIERAYAEYRSIWEPIDAAVRPMTVLGERVSVKALKLITRAAELEALVEKFKSCNFCNKAYAHYQVEGKSVAVRLCMTCADDLRKGLR